MNLFRSEEHTREERATPRASFAGHVLTTPWDKLQELYFVSYALWNYLATPFVFTEPGFETREIGPHEENGETWHRLCFAISESATSSRVGCLAHRNRFLGGIQVAAPPRVRAL